jgi:predicted short-subunit dehydrogenase-like oxidoreductase (DUF2520 family)
METKTLNIVGCGKAARTLGRLWAERSVFQLAGVLNRSSESAVAAVAFMGAGRALSGIEDMERADVYLIGTPDDRLAEASRILADAGLVVPGSIVFHLSGATRADALGYAGSFGALLASVHPVKSFADPALSVETFDGTYCGAEGDGPAVAMLCEAFEAIGGRMFAIDPSHKAVYHAASVFSCNYLTALIEAGLRAYARAGIPRDTAIRIAEPILRETLDNIIERGTTDALTGPIARGDHGTVARQIAALREWDPGMCALYKRLGSVALELSRARGTASDESVAALDALLMDE